MAKFSGLQAITANRLLTGEVVYFSDAFKWVTDLSKAALYRCEAFASDGLAMAKLGLREDPVIDPYLFDLTEDASNQRRPVKEREIIRAGGPTVAVALNTRALGSAA